MIAWVDPPADDVIQTPIIGGLFKDKDGHIMAWSGYDPDQNILCYAYVRVETPGVRPTDPMIVTETWEVNAQKNIAHPAWMKNKGPLHPGQFRPTDIKMEQKTSERCTTYNGVKFHGITAKSNKPKIALATFKKNYDSI